MREHPPAGNGHVPRRVAAAVALSLLAFLVGLAAPARYLNLAAAPGRPAAPPAPAGPALPPAPPAAPSPAPAPVAAYPPDPPLRPDPGRRLPAGAIIPWAPPPGAPAVPPALRLQVPVLMYHEIGAVENNLYVRESELADHLDYLFRNGYRAVTLKQVYQHLTAGAPLPARPVVITFDDGYASFYEVAFPLLRRYNYPATLFVITGRVGMPNYVTWDQVREMDRAGIEMAAHTVNHADLTALGQVRLEHEILGSRQALEQQLGHAPEFFAYPAGRHNWPVMEAVRQAGYLGAVTTLYGATGGAQDPYAWHRVRVNRRVSGAALGRQLTLATGR